LKDSDTPGIDEVLLGHYPAMLRRASYLLRSETDAEDVAQEVMLELIKAPHALAGVERLGAWLYTLVYRRCMDIIRRNTRRRDKETRAGAAELFDGGDFEQMMDTEEVCAAVAKALEQLQASLRFVFEQNVLEGFTFRQISKKSKIPMGTLMARKKKAMDLIRKQLRRQGLLE